MGTISEGRSVEAMTKAVKWTISCFDRIASSLMARMLLLALLANLFVSCAGTQIKGQAGIAQPGGSIDMSQTSIQNNYIKVVAKDGTATSLIVNARSISDLEILLGRINRESSAALGAWEQGLRSYYEHADPDNAGYTNARKMRLKATQFTNEAVSSTKKELRNLQQRASKALVNDRMKELKGVLFLIDGLASELAGRLGKDRPILPGHR